MTPIPRRSRRAGDVVRVLVGLVVVLHGLIHLMGVWPQAAADAPIPDPGPAGRVLWLVAALAVTLAGVGLLAGRRRWWSLGAPAMAVSQVAVLTAWPAAAAGTVANVLLALAVVHGWLAEGPRSRRARYRSHQAEVLADAGPAVSITEGDLAALPPLVATYLRRAGAVGRPRAAAFRAVLSGRIRSAPDAPWMAFVAEQVNTLAPQVTRWFRMDATMLGLPVDVLHVYSGGEATMSAAACSTIRVSQMSGVEAGHAETVTVLNDVCVLAPWALVDLPVDWSTVDDRRVRAGYTCGEHRVSAVLVFDDAGDLVDFVSDDRARIDGERGERLRWSTPVGGFAELGAGRLPTVGAALWHAPEGTYPYIEMQIHDVQAISASGDRPGSRLSARGHS